MRIDTSKTHAVVDSETNISIKWHDSKEEAQEQADFMTGYHGRKFEVRELKRS